jgi:hypothetical protein
VKFDEHNADIVAWARLKQQLDEVDKRIDSRTPDVHDEERRIVAMRARADELYRDAGLVGSPMPVPFERADTFRRRVMGDLARIGGSKFSQKDLMSIKDETVLTNVERDIFDAAKEKARFYGLKPGQIRERVVTGGGGHKAVEFDGLEGTHFVDQFRRRPFAEGVSHPRDAWAHARAQADREEAAGRAARATEAMRQFLVPAASRGTAATAGF